MAIKVDSERLLTGGALGALAAATGGGKTGAGAAMGGFAEGQLRQDQNATNQLNAALRANLQSRRLTIQEKQLDKQLADQERQRRNDRTNALLRLFPNATPQAQEQLYSEIAAMHGLPPEAFKARVKETEQFKALIPVLNNPNTPAEVKNDIYKKLGEAYGLEGFDWTNLDKMFGDFTPDEVNDMLEQVDDNGRFIVSDPARLLALMDAVGTDKVRALLKLKYPGMDLATKLDFELRRRELGFSDFDLNDILKVAANQYIHDSIYGKDVGEPSEYVNGAINIWSVINSALQRMGKTPLSDQGIDETEKSTILKMRRQKQVTVDAIKSGIVTSLSEIESAYSDAQIPLPPEFVQEFNALLEAQNKAKSSGGNK